MPGRAARTRIDSEREANAMDLTTLARDEFRFLTFRDLSGRVRTQHRAYLTFGLGFTLLAGVGRYWDNPRAQLWQQWGLGSLAYVFVLSLVLWALLAPLRPKRWTYGTVLLFVLAVLSSPFLLATYASEVYKARRK